MACDDPGFLSKLLPVALGWVLGIASQPLTHWITSRNEKKRFLSGLTAELVDARFRTACLAGAIASKVGAYDRQFLIWLRDEMRAYKGQHPRDRLADNLERILAARDEDLDAMVTQITAQDQRNSAAMSGITLPFCDARIDSLSLLTDEQQSLILNARRTLEVMNAKIADVHSWIKMTFQTLTPENYDSVAANERSSLRVVFNAARQATNEMRGFLETIDLEYRLGTGGP